MNIVLFILYILLIVVFVICNVIGYNFPIKNAKNKTRNMIVSLMLTFIGMVGSFLWGFYLDDVIKILLN